MKKIFAAGLMAALFAASGAFAFEVPSTQPIKGTEGPGIRATDDQRPGQPVKGTEGPDIR
jgi:hypothetical protein